MSWCSNFDGTRPVGSLLSPVSCYLGKQEHRLLSAKPLRQRPCNQPRTRVNRGTRHWQGICAQLTCQLLLLLSHTRLQMCRPGLGICMQRLHSNVGGWLLWTYSSARPSEALHGCRSCLVPMS
jgi:hypothetical protein